MAGNSGIEYVVQTNLAPEQLSAVGLEIFGQWLDFALGGIALGGRMLKHPTGRYASSIAYKANGEYQISIMANSGVAPEADIIESGHARFDLKSKFKRGRSYPMHRGSGGAPTLRSSMWAAGRRKSSTGFASIGPNSKADSWILPAFPAYSPAKILAELAAKIGREGGLK